MYNIVKWCNVCTYIYIYYNELKTLSCIHCWYIESHIKKERERKKKHMYAYGQRFGNIYLSIYLSIYKYIYTYRTYKFQYKKKALCCLQNGKKHLTTPMSFATLSWSSRSSAWSLAVACCATDPVEEAEIAENHRLPKNIRIFFVKILRPLGQNNWLV